MSDSELTIDGLASRLERVERLNSGLRNVVALLAALVAVFIIISQSNMWPMTSRNVVAESFSLRNSNGDTVALLSVTSNGTGNLSLWDAQRNLRLSIGLNVKGSPYVTLTDAQQNPRATLYIDNNQEPTLLLADAQRKVRATFGLDRNSSPMLEFNDSDGVRRWVATTGGAKEVLVPK